MGEGEFSGGQYEKSRMMYEDEDVVKKPIILHICFLKITNFLKLVSSTHFPWLRLTQPSGEIVFTCPLSAGKFRGVRGI